MTTDYFAGDDRTSYERMAAGDLYIADDPEIARGVQRGLRLVDAFHRAVLDGDGDQERAREILADLLGSLGEDSWVKPPLAVDFGTNVHLGDRTFVNSGLTALDVAAITIGDNTVVGARSVVTRDLPANVVAVGNPARVIRENI